jgi:hypothetical protein
MNLAHVHLVLNHIPPIVTLLGLLFLALAIFRESEELKRISLGTFVLVAVISVPVYLTGDPAAEIVKDLPGVSQAIIEAHAEAATIALGAAEVLGVVALAGLIFFRRRATLPRWFVVVGLALALVVGVLMVRTANLGGQIRHSEIRTTAQPS